jgi:hypothetical protein
VVGPFALQAVHGIFPAACVGGEDVALYSDGAAYDANTPAATMHMLRQQLEKETTGEPCVVVLRTQLPPPLTAAVGRDSERTVHACDRLASESRLHGASTAHVDSFASAIKY